MAKQILIKNCKDPARWYADKIGETVQYLGGTGSEYISLEPSGYINFVQYEDCEIITSIDGD